MSISDDEDTKLKTDTTNQHIEKLLNPKSEDDKDAVRIEVHTPRSNINDERSEVSNRSTFKLLLGFQLLLDAWESSLEWENIFVGQASAVIIIVIILSVFHKFRVMEPVNVYRFQLDCDKLASKFDFLLFIWQFVHTDLEHIIGNLLALIIYGCLVESILGTIPFGVLFSCLCYFIPREWYHDQLKTNSCQTARTVVGLSGVTYALGPIAIFLTLYRTICILLRMKFFSPDRSDSDSEKFSFVKRVSKVFSENPKLKGLCWFYFIGLAFSLLSVVGSCLYDTIFPCPDVAIDIHWIGTKQGFLSALPLVGFCILQDLSRPIINKAKGENKLYNLIFD